MTDDLPTGAVVLRNAGRTLLFPGFAWALFGLLCDGPGSDPLTIGAAVMVILGFALNGVAAFAEPGR